jgi:hypothetical protein
MRKFNRGDFVEIIQPGGNYNYFPGRDIVKSHSKISATGLKFYVEEIYSRGNDEDKILGFLIGLEWVCFGAQALKLVKSKETIYEIF